MTKIPTGLTFLTNIIDTALFSAYLKEKSHRPLSVLIVAEPEHGKTECLLQYVGNKGIEIIQDATSFGLIVYIFQRIISGEIKHLIFPSFEKIFTRHKQVVTQVLLCLNNIVEEGIGYASILTKNIPFLANETKKARAGVIIGCVPDVIIKHETKLKQYGFWSRMLPIFYEYNEEDKERIHEEIKRGEYKFEKRKLKFPKNPKKVVLPKEIADKLDPIIKFLEPSIGSYTGFRIRKIFQTFLKANALKNGRKEVKEEDLKEVVALIPFIYNKPAGGDECCWKILRNIFNSPKTVYQLTQLTGYSKATVYRRVEELKNAGIVENVGGEIRLKFKF